MMKTPVKRLLLLSACAVGAAFLFSLGLRRGFLSPRGLAVAILILGVAVGSWAVLLVKQSANDLAAPPAPSSSPLDSVTRRRRLLGIRMGKVAIVALALLLILSLFRGGPPLALIVAGVVNVCIIAAIIHVVVRLQRSLR